MATRKTSKVRSRQEQAPESEAAVLTVSPNGRSTAEIASTTNGASPSFEQIQRRAYELFLARGGLHGCDLADWFTAEQELTTTSAAAH
jgi:Protein of unknown function (DUF2934)